MANRVLYELALEYTQYHGMGTTVAILVVSPTLIVTANVGDSRVYMIRNGNIERLSRDHTIVTEQDPQFFPVTLFLTPAKNSPKAVARYTGDKTNDQLWEDWQVL